MTCFISFADAKALAMYERTFKLCLHQAIAKAKATMLENGYKFSLFDQATSDATFV